MVNEENGSGTLEATYVHHPGRQIGTVLATSAGSTASSGTWRYYYQDAIGSTRSVWDELGARTGKYEYTPFGGKYADHGDEDDCLNAIVGGAYGLFLSHKEHKERRVRFSVFFALFVAGNLPFRAVR